MKYAYQLNIICNTQATLFAVAAELPLITDPEVWDGDYREVTQGTDLDGNEVLSAIIMFNTEAGRDSIEAAIDSIAGMLYDCEVGTTIKLVESYHDTDDGKGSPTQLCDETTIYEVVA